MRILLIVVYYPPIPNAAGQLMRDLALEYVRQGHQVFVLTPSNSIGPESSVSDENGVTVVRVKFGDIKNAKRLLRLWRESRLSSRLWRSAHKLLESNPCDLIVFYSPTIFFGELVNWLKKLWKCPSYLILRDLFPQWAVDTGLLREESVVFRYLKRKEIEQYRSADVIGVQAQGNLSYFKEEFPGHHFCVETLNNWIGNTPCPQSTSGWRERLRLDGKIVFFYGGNIGVAQDMDNILRLASGLRGNDELFFLIMGTGSEVPRLQGEIERLALANIRILPAAGEQEYLECLKEFDVGLVTLDRRLRSHNIPGKLLSYMLCGLPVLASVNPGNDLMRIIEEAEAGICCANGDDEKLRDAALLLATQELLRKRMGLNARDLGRRSFSVETISKQILANFHISN
jgi:glycosyltransferase involved in cell wall biosynthesis